MKSRLSVRCVDSLILKVAVLVTIINVGVYIVLVPSKNQSPKVHETKVIINNFYLSKPGKFTEVKKLGLFVLLIILSNPP